MDIKKLHELAKEAAELFNEYGDYSKVREVEKMATELGVMFEDGCGEYFSLDDEVYYLDN